MDLVLEALVDSLLEVVVVSLLEVVVDLLPEAVVDLLPEAVAVLLSKNTSTFTFPHQNQKLSDQADQSKFQPHKNTTKSSLSKPQPHQPQLLQFFQLSLKMNKRLSSTFWLKDQKKLQKSPYQPQLQLNQANQKFTSSDTKLKRKEVDSLEVGFDSRKSFLKIKNFIRQKPNECLFCLFVKQELVELSELAALVVPVDSLLVVLEDSVPVVPEDSEESVESEDLLEAPEAVLSVAQEPVALEVLVVTVVLATVPEAALYLVPMDHQDKAAHTKLKSSHKVRHCSFPLGKHQ